MNKLAKIFSIISLFLIPFYFIRFDFLVPTNVFELAVLLSFLLTVANLLIGKKEHKINNLKNWIMPILLLLIVLSSIYLADDKTKALGVFKGWFYVPIIFSWVIGRNFSKKEFTKLSVPIFASLMVVSIWALLQKMGFVGTAFYQVGDGSFVQYISGDRVFGPFESPNFLAMYLVPALFISLPTVLLLRKKMWRIIFYCSLSLPILSLFFTGSRAGIITLTAAGLLGLGLMLHRNKKSKTLYLLVFLFFAIGVFFISSLYLFGHAASDDIRKEIYRYSLEILKNNWIYGLGLGDFQHAIDLISKGNEPFQKWGLPYALHPHNLYLAFWLNAGLSGMIVFLVLIGQVFIRLRFHTFLSACYAIALIAILLHGLFDTTYFKNDLSAMFWLIFALGVKNAKQQKIN